MHPTYPRRALGLAVRLPGQGSAFLAARFQAIGRTCGGDAEIEAAKTKASFIEPMLLLPEGPDWLYEVKLDGYRALAIKAGGKVQLRSRNNNDFSHKFPLVVEAL